MKLLYMSCHAILEYDELKLFEEMGIDYFSLGSYVNPQKPVDPIRPALFKAPNSLIYGTAPDRRNIPKEWIDNFDTIMVMHVPEWIEDNWEKMRGKRVIWRSIGQSSPLVERRLKKYRAEGLEIVRYSPREEKIPDYMGADTVIRFYKDPDEFKLYNGLNREAITFSQNMVSRRQACHFNYFQDIVGDLPAKVYGPKNEETGKYNGGFLGYDEMRQKMRDSRVYVYTGTQPASYTLNFIEAWMTGAPIVAIGPTLWNDLHLAGDVYEVGDLIDNGLNGFVSDDIGFLKDITRRLMDDETSCSILGQAGRKRAIELFGKDVIKSQWKQYLRV